MRWQDLGHPISSQFSSSSPVTIDVPLGDMSQGLLGSNQLTTIDHSELSAQLGLGLGGGNILQRPQSPENPLSATASPTSSLQDDDMDDFRRVRNTDDLLHFFSAPLRSCLFQAGYWNGCGSVWWMTDDEGLPV